MSPRADTMGLIDRNAAQFLSLVESLEDALKEIDRNELWSDIQHLDRWRLQSQIVVDLFGRSVRFVSLCQCPRQTQSLVVSTQTKYSRDHALFWRGLN